MKYQRDDKIMMLLPRKPIYVEQQPHFQLRKNIWRGFYTALAEYGFLAN